MTFIILTAGEGLGKHRKTFLSVNLGQAFALFQVLFNPLQWCRLGILVLMFFRNRHVLDL